MASERIDGLYDYRSVQYRRAFLRSLRVDWESLHEESLREYQQTACTQVFDALDASSPKLLHLATGGGKTRTANAIVEKWLESEWGHDSAVLWLTKDWRLLAQAAVDFKSRRPGGYVNRIGGEGRELHPLIEFYEPGGLQPSVLYSTIQTIQRDVSRYLDDVEPSLVVWDECHWGEQAGAAKIITECKRRKIAMLGLTATPRGGKSRWKVAYSKTFAELVDMRVLAKPKPETVETGVNWSPTLNGMRDADRTSLRDLARSARRNREIVRRYVAGEYGKSVVFACDIEHATLLAAAFQKAGVNAAAAHSKMEYEHEAFETVHKFKHGAIDVLVNVEMLTHGVDIPDINTVFLARPTTSDILFAQMVGRAARRHDESGKKTFTVVDFVDNIVDHGELFDTPKTHFWGAMRE